MSSPSDVLPEPFAISPDYRAATAISRAIQAWKADIVDPPGDGPEYAESRNWIRRFIGEGLGWSSDAAHYRHDGQFAWCGAFVAWCYAGVGLRADVRRVFLASTLRLDALARGHTWNGRLPPQTMSTRRLQLDDIQPGDVVTVGGDLDSPGNHIGLVEQTHGDGLTTIEGNAYGPGPTGVKREGVIRRRRPYDVRLLVRFAAEDYD